MRRIDWTPGQQIAPHVWYQGDTDKGLGVILETDTWSDFFRILFNDFMGKYVFRKPGSDIKIVVRKAL
jgi:hypothetical protein